MKTVTMFGLAFDESGALVEREVPECDVLAFKNAGYQVGKLPEKEWSNNLGETSYTLEDSIAQLDEPKKKKGRK